MSDVLTNLQQDLAARLQAAEYFADIPVLTEAKGDIEKEIMLALGVVSGRQGKIGACVVVMQMIANDSQPNVDQLALQAMPTIRVYERVLFNQGPNGTKKPALSIATAVAQHLKLYSAAGLCHEVNPDSPLITPYADKNPQLLAYEVQFTSSVAQDEYTPWVATPVITPASGAAPQEVVIGCATADAVIRYTLNGKPPYEGQTGAQVYSAPITISEACTLRACASKSGCISSNSVMGIYI